MRRRKKKKGEERKKKKGGSRTEGRRRRRKMVSKESGEEEMRRRRRRIRGFLGLGFCVQGFRCFPWTAIVFFLKDSLNASPSTLQLLQNSANLPMVGKPLYGVVSDAVYVGGQHRIPYIAVGGNPFSPPFLIHFCFFSPLFSRTLIFLFFLSICLFCVIFPF